MQYVRILAKEKRLFIGLANRKQFLQKNFAFFKYKSQHIVRWWSFIILSKDDGLKSGNILA